MGIQEVKLECAGEKSAFDGLDPFIHVPEHFKGLGTTEKVME